MMRKLLFITCLLWLVGITANAEEIPNDEIWYEASAKLTETIDLYSSGLHTNAFNTSISSHTFSSGKGIIKFNGNVTSIGDYAFYYCSGLTSITIPNSVTSIGNAAFYNCSGLTSITIPNSVTSIGVHAFSDCSSLTSITIPNSVTSIGTGAFYDCTSLPVENNLRYADTYLVGAVDKTQPTYTIKEKTKWIGSLAFYECSALTSITIPNSVTSIGQEAFSYCKGLTSISIPNSVTSIGDQAFEYCPGLTSVEVDSLNKYYDSRNNCNAIIEKTTSKLIAGCKNTTIPNSVTSIGGGAFAGCSGLTSITIPNSVTSIGDYAFSSCTSLPVENNLRYADTYLVGAVNKTLSTYTIKEGTKWIGTSAFYGCKGLTSITIPNSVTSIGDYAFDNCSGLTSISIPNSVTSIGDGAFHRCSGLTSVTIPDSVTSIGSYAFSNCSGLTSITIPNSVTSIGNYAFSYCKGLTSISIPNSVTSIGYGAFEYCSRLTSITIPNSVTSIGDDTFYYCSSLTSITIPNSVTSIGGGAFAGCSGLTSVKIPDSVTSIGRYAFSNCSGLTSVIIGNSVTSIGDYAFSDCSSLTSITIPNSVTSIGNRAFPSSGIEELNINITDFANNNIIIGYISSAILHYYYNDKKIEGNATLPENLKTIGNRALYSCKAIESITIPNSVTSIGKSAFYNCSGLTSVTIPNSVTSIGNYAFRYCSGLTSITIPNSVTSIGGYAFQDCKGLTSITIPNSVTSIGEYAFSGCKGLASVTIPNSVTSIENSAFSVCSSLSKMYFKGEVPPAFGSSSVHGTLFVPIGSKQAYSTAANYSDIVEVAYNNGFVLQPASDKTMGVISYVGTDDSSDTQVIPSTVEAGSVIYTVNSIQSSALKNDKRLINVVIPNTVETLGNYCFDGCSNLKSVTLSKNISIISNYAFRNCTSLESIEFLAGTTSLGQYAFSGCTSLESVSMKNNLSVIGNYCFYGCEKLKGITLSNKITQIGSYAFGDCQSLAEFSVPSTCTSIGAGAFANCKGITEFFVEEANTSYSAIDGVLMNKAHTTIVSYPNAKGTSYTIPNSVTTIGSHAFYGCDLVGMSIPSTITTLNDYAFASCPNLKSFTIEGSSSSVKCYSTVLENSGVESVTINRNITNASPFQNNISIKDVIIGDKVTSLLSNMFHGCTGLTSIALSNTISSISSSAFYNCSSLTSINLPTNLSSIGSSAFYNCSSLTSITIPASVTSIGSGFLSGCTSMKTIISKIVTPPSMQASDFTDINKQTCILIVPDASVDEYMETPGWLSFDNVIGESSWVPATSINLGASSLSMKADKNYTLTATILPENATCKSVTWSSSDESVATVSEAGVVTAVSVGTAMISATTNDGTNLSASCEVTVTPPNFTAIDKNGNTIKKDIEQYDDIVIKDEYVSVGIYEEVADVNVIYSRTFKNTNWQPLYVPFDMDVTSELLSNFSFAKYAGTYTEDDGTFCITIAKLNEGGKIKANTPYFIKAKVADSSNPQIISAEITTLHATAETENYMQSAEKKISIYGIYNKKTFTAEEVAEKNVYGYGGGTYNPQTAGQSLGAFRFYIKLTNREDNMYGTDTPSSIKIKVLGDDDDTTSIDNLKTSTESDNNIYDLSGRAVSNPKHGVYIKNGKKYYVK